MKAGFIMARDVSNLVPAEQNGGFILNISRGANLWQNDLMVQTPSLAYQSLVATNYRTNSTLSGADLICSPINLYREQMLMRVALLRNL